MTVERRRWLLKRLVFYLLRLRQPIRLADDRIESSGARLRLLLLGSEERLRDALVRFYGKEPETRLLGWSLLPPTPHALALPPVERDLELIEINRLALERYQAEGHFPIPQWVEFGCPVTVDEERRYEDADQWLRQAIRGVQTCGLAPRPSRDPGTLERFYEQMYRPYVLSRYGDATILKSPRQARRDFRSGFVLWLERDGQPVAGGLVRIDGSRVVLRAIGMLPSDPDLTGRPVSAAIDFHLHAWAAEHGKAFIDVGHTRPFPRDGVYFNKRKWRMEIRPDFDGVMNLALRWRRHGPRVRAALAEAPFVYQTRAGLGVFTLHEVGHPMDADEAHKMMRLFWTPGLSSLIALCPQGLAPGVLQELRQAFGQEIHVVTNLQAADRTLRTLP